MLDFLSQKVADFQANKIIRRIRGLEVKNAFFLKSVTRAADRELNFVFKVAEIKLKFLRLKIATAQCYQSRNLVYILFYGTKTKYYSVF